MSGGPRPRFFFDYVDPLSYLVERELTAALEADSRAVVERIPLEVRPPPEPLLDPDGPWWRERWQAAIEAARSVEGPRLMEPPLLPWTRKAHELVRYAAEEERGAEAHHAVFDAFFSQGRDIGRVDVLVEIGRALGLDPTHTKVVLDVDRYAGAVAAAGREAASEAAGSDPPVLTRGDRTLRGFHNRDALLTFLLR